MIIGDGIMLGAGGESASIFVTGLSETDSVSASKDGKTVIGKWTQIPNPSYVVPDGYTQLEYIQNTGTQYIDTGILLNPLNGFEIDCKFSTLTSGVRQLIVGNYRDGNEESLNVEITAADALRYYASGDVGSYTKVSTGEIYNVHVEYSNSTKLLSFSSELGSASATKSYTTAFTSKMRLFLDNRSGPTATFGSEKIRMYQYSVSVGGTYIQNLIPCKRNSDNTIGMYDIVSGAFYTNAGTGTFVAGEEVPQTIYGFLIDKIKSYGTWTVTATNGTKIATGNVLIDSAIQYNIEISYLMWLYKYGNQYEDATGGWQCWKKAGTSELLDTSIHIASSDINQWQCTSTKMKINLTNFSNAKAEVKIESQKNAQYCALGLRICNDVNTSTSTDPYLVRKEIVSDIGTHIITVDISDLNGEYYIAFEGYYVGSAYIYKVWLE